MSYGIWRNCEGYSDPTAGKAMSNILAKERSDRRKAKRRESRRLRKEAVNRLAENTENKEVASDDDQGVPRTSVSTGSADQQQTGAGVIAPGSDN